MTSGITAIHASAPVSANESALSLGVQQAGVRQAAATSLTSAGASPSNPKSSVSREDTVQLSSSAQQYLQASAQANATTTGPGSQPTLENVVKAVAAGDRGALSLLIVI